MNTFNKYNVALIPDYQSVEAIIDMARTLSKGKLTKYVTSQSQNGYEPHISVYKFLMNPDQKSDLVTRFNHMTKLTSLQLKGRQICITGKKGYVYLEIEKNKNLIGLQSQAITTLQPISKMPLQRYVDSLKKIKSNAVAYEYYLKYSSPDLFEYWTPHITLFRLLNEDVDLAEYDILLKDDIAINVQYVQLYSEEEGELSRLEI